MRNPATGNILDLLKGLLTQKSQNLHGDGMEGSGSEPPSKYKRGGSTQQILTPQLIIVDPLNKFNNIGKSSYNFSVF